MVFDDADLAGRGLGGVPFVTLGSFVIQICCKLPQVSSFVACISNYCVESERNIPSDVKRILTQYGCLSSDITNSRIYPVFVPQHAFVIVNIGYVCRCAISCNVHLECDQLEIKGRRVVNGFASIMWINEQNFLTQRS